MVRLKSYECYHCHNPFKPYYTNGKQIGSFVCNDCERLVCGKCKWNFTKNEGLRPKCEKTNIECILRFSFDPYIGYLEKFASEDELKFLKFSMWSPIWCNTCKHPITRDRRLCSVKPYTCSTCSPSTQQLDSKVLFYMNIIDELSDYFSDSPSESTIRKRDVVRLSTVKCGLCNEKGEFVDGCVTESGLLVFDCCKFCGEKCYDICLTENAAMFSTFVYYIPNVQDLKLLTYSKWTPLRCEQCSVPFAENEHSLPLFHVDSYKLICSKCSSVICPNGSNGTQPIALNFLVDIIKEFRALFNLSDIEMPQKVNEIQAVQADDEVKDKLEENEIQAVQADDAGKDKVEDLPLQTESSDYDAELLLRDRGFNFLPSNSIKCAQCKQVDEISKLHNCLTCEVGNICQGCLISNHWGHEIKSATKTFMEILVQDHHESTVRKLQNWGDKVRDLVDEGRAIHSRLCDGYNNLFTTALESDDLARVYDALYDGNVMQLHALVSNFTIAQNKFNKGLEAVCEKVESLRCELDE